MSDGQPGRGRHVGSIQSIVIWHRAAANKARDGRWAGVYAVFDTLLLEPSHRIIVGGYWQQQERRQTMHTCLKMGNSFLQSSMAP